MHENVRILQMASLPSIQLIANATDICDINLESLSPTSPFQNEISDVFNSCLLVKNVQLG